MLKRDISTTNVLVAAAGGMIGSGWLFSPFISAQIAGSNALIAWIIAAIFMLFIALPLCELGTMFPVSGGMANYPSFTHGPEVGFLFAWASWLSYVVMTPIEIQAIMEKRRGNQLQAAKMLGISRGTIRKKLQRYFGTKYFRLTDE